MFSYRFFCSKSFGLLLINAFLAVIISGNISGMPLQRLRFKACSWRVRPYMGMLVARASGLGIFGLNRGKRALAGE